MSLEGPRFMSRGVGAVLGVLLLGCGPGVELEPVAEASGTSSSTGTEAPASSSSTAITTAATTILDGGTDSSGGSSSDGFPDPDASGCPYAPPGSSFHSSCFSCDIVAQSCPRGEKCMPWSNDGSGVWNATRCSPIDDAPGAPGDPCTVEGAGYSGIDDCDLGAMCWSVDPETNEGVCIGFCDPADDPCRAPQHCALLSVETLPICVTPCHPLDPAGCPAGEACRWVADQQDEFLCLPEASGYVDESGRLCGEPSSVCGPTEACLPDQVHAACDSTACCTPWCTVGDPASDTMCAALRPEHVCRPWFPPGEAPLGYFNVGACALDLP